MTRNQFLVNWAYKSSQHARYTLVALAAIGLMLFSSAPIFAADYTQRLDPGTTLYPGDAIWSPNHLYQLIQQADGNLVEYSMSAHTAIWASGTFNYPGTVTQLQTDGNLVVYGPGHLALWASNTAGHSDSVLFVQDDANMVIYAPGNVAIWAANTRQNPDSAQALAQQILANPRIDKGGRLVLADLQAAAAGRSATAGRPLSATLLRLIVTLGQGHSLRINALESGGTGHSTNSYHYSGDAVDIGRLDGQDVTGRNAPSLTIIRALAPLMPPGSGFGQSNCGRTPPLPSGIVTFYDTCDHLHVQVPRTAP